VSAAPVTAGFQPTDPGFISNPHPVFHEMRTEAPVSQLPGRKIWAVTSYEHVRALMRDPRVVTVLEPRAPSPQPVPPVSRDQHPFYRAREESQRMWGRFFPGRPADDHTNFRRLIRPSLARKRVAARRAYTQAITDERIDRAVVRGGIDVVQDLARPLALTTAAELMGIPEAQVSDFATTARELVPPLDVLPTALSRERGLFAMTELAARLRPIVPAADDVPEGEATVLDLLAGARRDGELTDEDVVANGLFVFVLSHLSTQHFVGTAVLSLVRNPDQWDLLRRRPDTIATAIDELLRYEPSAPVMQRIARDDIEIAGTTIPQGSGILLLIAAANRDPAVFADPDGLDVTRSPNPHLGFGHGAHGCMGAALARLEAEVAVGTLVRRIANPRLERDDLEWEPTFAVRGLKSLPLTFEDARR
jgi:cytochrome P450